MRLAGNKSLIQTRLVRAVAFSPDGKRVATASHGLEGSKASTVHVWDAATGLPLLPPITNAPA